MYVVVLPVISTLAHSTLAIKLMLLKPRVIHGINSVFQQHLFSLRKILKRIPQAALTFTLGSTETWVPPWAFRTRPPEVEAQESAFPPVYSHYFKYIKVEEPSRA